MKNIILILLMVVGYNCMGQTNFEKDYFINNSGQKIECLIKNFDWLNNPVEFQYKISESVDAKTETIASIKEFGIYEITKFERVTVNIDRSSSKITLLGVDRNPDFKEEELFLKILVEGEATLYKYTDNGLVRFFYKLNELPIEQLVYKTYRSDGDDIKENNYYRQQLLNVMKCENISSNDFEKLDYREKDLSNLFESYNLCNNNLTSNFEKKNNKDLIHLRAKAGLGVGSLSIEDRLISDFTVDLNSEIILRFGVELEILLPFNNKKWAFVIEPSYQSYKSTVTKNNPDSVSLRRELEVEADYSTIEIPLGIRHYFYLNDTSGIFANAFYDFVLVGKSKVTYSSGFEYDIENSSGQALGVGYWNNKYSVEARYEFKREILDRYTSAFSNYNQITLVLGYKFL